jgi:hypothetical protein
MGVSGSLLISLRLIQRSSLASQSHRAVAGRGNPRLAAVPGSEVAVAAACPVLPGQRGLLGAPTCSSVGRLAFERTVDRDVDSAPAT